MSDEFEQITDLRGYGSLILWAVIDRIVARLEHEGVSQERVIAILNGG